MDQKLLAGLASLVPAMVTAWVLVGCSKDISVDATQQGSQADAGAEAASCINAACALDQALGSTGTCQDCLQAQCKPAVERCGSFNESCSSATSCIAGARSNFPPGGFPSENPLACYMGECTGLDMQISSDDDKAAAQLFQCLASSCAAPCGLLQSVGGYPPTVCPDCVRFSEGTDPDPDFCLRCCYNQPNSYVFLTCACFEEGPCYDACAATCAGGDGNPDSACEECIFGGACDGIGLCEEGGDCRLLLDCYVSCPAS